MKTIITFSSGFVLAIVVLSVLTGYQKQTKRKTQICHDCKKDNFKEVDLDTFYNDIGRYYGTHAKDVRGNMVDAIISAEVGFPASNLSAGRRRGVIEDLEIDKIKPSRICMYSLDTLKKFICFIETYADSIEANEKLKIDYRGINFFYAVYDKDKKFHDGTNVARLHTLYMVPSYYDPAEKAHIAVDWKASMLYRTLPKFKQLIDDDWAKYWNNLKVNEKKAAKYKELKFPLRLDQLYRIRPHHRAYIMHSSAVMAATSSAPDGPIINQGQLCPPACSGISLDNDARGYNN